MKIGHFSDNHGHLDRLLFTSDIPDLWISSGDFFPDKPDLVFHPVTNKPMSSSEYQKYWFNNKNCPFPNSAGMSASDIIIKRLNGKPIICVDGNHDFACLAECLIENGCPNVIHIDNKKGQQSVEIGGLVFAGFREIPYIAGYFAGEASDNQLRQIVKETMDCEPDVLVTHCPPTSILDNGFGVFPLFHSLATGEHKIKHHFFGHVHQRNGIKEQMDIIFYNSATIVRFVEI